MEGRRTGEVECFQNDLSVDGTVEQSCVDPPESPSDLGDGGGGVHLECVYVLNVPEPRFFVLLLLKPRITKNGFQKKYYML